MQLSDRASEQKYVKRFNQKWWYLTSDIQIDWGELRNGLWNDWLQPSGLNPPVAPLRAVIECVWHKDLSSFAFPGSSSIFSHLSRISVASSSVKKKQVALMFNSSAFWSGLFAQDADEAELGEILYRLRLRLDKQQVSRWSIVSLWFSELRVSLADYCISGQHKLQHQCTTLNVAHFLAGPGPEWVNM